LNADYKIISKQKEFFFVDDMVLDALKTIPNDIIN